MLIKDIVTESLSPTVYHATDILAANHILQTGRFQLSHGLGSVEQSYMPPGYFYFLSTTRTRRGGYHDRGYKTSQGAVFELDGSYYNQRYRARAVDYWLNRNPQASHHRKSEAEDRLFSKKPTIDIGGVKSVHILVGPDADDRHRVWARRALIAAKQRGIPAYFYTDYDAWLNLSRDHTGKISTLSGQDQTRGYTRRHRGYLLPWIELLKASSKDQLSKQADSIRYNLQYTYNAQDAVKGLEVDLSNARKPDSGSDRKNAETIIEFMRQNGLRSVADFAEYLKRKWLSAQGKISEIETVPATVITDKSKIS